MFKNNTFWSFHLVFYLYKALLVQVLVDPVYAAGCGVKQQRPSFCVLPLHDECSILHHQPRHGQLQLLQLTNFNLGNIYIIYTIRHYSQVSQLEITTTVSLDWFQVPAYWYASIIGYNSYPAVKVTAKICRIREYLLTGLYRNSNSSVSRNRGLLGNGSTFLSHIDKKWAPIRSLQYICTHVAIKC